MPQPSEKQSPVAREDTLSKELQQLLEALVLFDVETLSKIA
jgi:hypothetical protein